MSLENQWERNLTDLSRLLIPSEEDLSSGKAVADRVFHTLQQKSKYRVDRVGLVGSVEKKTALKIDVDFDCVVFVNDVRPPFDKVFEDFAYVLQVRDDLKVDAKYPRKWKNSLQAKINGKEFDICPAANFSSDPDVQRKKTMECIRRLPHPAKDGYKYSSGLAQSQIDFIKRQSPFTHDLIRLAKFWNKSIFIEDYISGRSSLIELIAVYAAHEEGKLCNVSLLRGFRRFLTLMSGFDTLNIVFDMFYGRHEIDCYIASQKPLVLDPCNPYNNFAHGIGKNGSLTNRIKQFAQTTIKRLEDGFATLSINSVFEPQPKVAPDESVKRCLDIKKWLVEICGGSINHPNMTVRNDEKVNNVGLKIIQHYLGNNIEFLNNSDSQIRIRDKVTGIIDWNICRLPRRWRASNDNHPEYDVTLEVPCGGSVVRASIKW